MQKWEHCIVRFTILSSIEGISKEESIFKEESILPQEGIAWVSLYGDVVPEKFAGDDVDGWRRYKELIHKLGAEGWELGSATDTANIITNEPQKKSILYDNHLYFKRSAT